MKTWYFIIGRLGFILTIAALILPIVPATPFLIISLYGFSKSSEKIHRYLVSLPFIAPLYQSLQKNQRFTRNQKVALTALSLPIAVAPFAFSDNILFHLTGIAIALLGIIVVWCYRRSPVKR